MNKTLLLLFNHEITPEQRRDAEISLGVRKTLAMPGNVKTVWAGVPPEPETISHLLEPVRRWLDESARPGDYVLIQGDYGACRLMIEFAFRRGLVPVYATTERIVTEESTPDGLKTTRLFKHRRFRRYEKE